MGMITTTDGTGIYRKDRGTRAAGRVQPRPPGPAPGWQ